MSFELKTLFIELPFVEYLMLPDVLFEELERGVRSKTAIECELSHFISSSSLDLAIGTQLNCWWLERHGVPFAELLVLGLPGHYCWLMIKIIYQYCVHQRDLIYKMLFRKISFTNKVFSKDENFFTLNNPGHLVRTPCPLISPWSGLPDNISMRLYCFKILTTGSASRNNPSKANSLTSSNLYPFTWPSHLSWVEDFGSWCRGMIWIACI